MSTARLLLVSQTGNGVSIGGGAGGGGGQCYRAAVFKQELGKQKQRVRLTPASLSHCVVFSSGGVKSFRFSHDNTGPCGSELQALQKRRRDANKTR